MKIIGRIYYSNQSNDMHVLLRSFVSSIVSSPIDISGVDENENIVCDSKVTVAIKHLSSNISMNKRVTHQLMFEGYEKQQIYLTCVSCL